MAWLCPSTAMWSPPEQWMSGNAYRRGLFRAGIAANTAKLLGLLRKT
jgi:hypothetical protein